MTTRRREAHMNASLGYSQFRIESWRSDAWRNSRWTPPELFRLHFIGRKRMLDNREVSEPFDGSKEFRKDSFRYLVLGFVDDIFRCLEVKYDHHRVVIVRDVLACLAEDSFDEAVNESLPE